MTTENTASIIMAAGRGSRMKGFGGSKTLLPLIPGKSPCEGERPILLHILDNLPRGPRALIVHHDKERVIAAAAGPDLTPIEQPALNGTGGALLAARTFIERMSGDRLIITMGDVPFVKRETYQGLVEKLSEHHLIVLGFLPDQKKQYGVLEMEESRVQRIIEWKYWRDFPPERQAALSICNSGIYAARREALLRYLPVLASRPQVVKKEVDGREIAFEEFFITDLVEYMRDDGLSIGCAMAGNEEETMGVDDLSALVTAQEIFRRARASPGAPPGAPPCAPPGARCLPDRD